MGTRVSNWFPFILLSSSSKSIHAKSDNYLVCHSFKWIQTDRRTSLLSLYPIFFFNWDEKLMFLNTFNKERGKTLQKFSHSDGPSNIGQSPVKNQFGPLRCTYLPDPNVQSDSGNFIDSKRQKSRKICYGSVKCIFLLDQFRHG